MTLPPAGRPAERLVAEKLLAVFILELAEVVRFERTIIASKAIALVQAKLYPNNKWSG